MSHGSPVALVTGAARRIGAAIARTLHDAGYSVAVHHRGSAVEATALVTELEAARAGSAVAVQADLAEADAPAAVVRAVVDRFGRLDALVNNASAFFPSGIDTLTVAQWDALFATNVRAPVFLAQAAAPWLRAAQGAVVNITDVYAQAPRADLAAYAASKGALEAATRVLAVALAPEVRVNAVAPGAILWPDAGIDPALRDALLARTPLGRTGTPEEIAATVLYLLRDAGYVTGTTIAVAGGRDG